jgi:hypothetical protein
VRDALETQRNGSAQQTLALHMAEKWRDDLIADDAALPLWLQAHPATDVQQLRALIRQARKDAPADADAISRGLAPRKGRAYREIFQLVRAALEGDEARHPMPLRRTPTMADHDPVTIGIVSVSDRASTGVYEDKGLPALQRLAHAGTEEPAHLRGAPDARRAGAHRRHPASSWWTPAARWC